MFCSSCFGKKEQDQDTNLRLKTNNSLTPSNSNVNNSQDSAKSTAPSTPSRNTHELHLNGAVVPSKPDPLSSAKEHTYNGRTADLPSPTSPSIIDPREIRWEPFVMERNELDRELCSRMKWNISGKAVEQTIVALSKFKMMAARAHATVAQRNAEQQHTPVVNSRRSSLAAASAAAAAALTGFAPGELDPETEEELRQMQARESRIAVLYT